MSRSLLMGLYHQFQRNFAPLNKSLKQQGLHLHDALILLALFFESPGKTTPSELEVLLHIGRDQVSQALGRLQAQNLIQRSIHHKDRRKRQIGITGQGEELSTHLIKFFDQYENRLEQENQTQASPL